MIGSPDLLAFTGAEGFGEEQEDQEAPSLPEELSVPLFPTSHPWSTSAQFNRDFILVAEFSEQAEPSASPGRDGAGRRRELKAGGSDRLLPLVRMGMVGIPSCLLFR
ncbi:Smith-Magenis syndrome chromosomal region candidate gene 8 protein homolog [Lates japonicus]|uniref:Smith-Magenis syndrome chromosomal region candidate gene 8 protein homolog n=1 Tax=Lates japonicus TaxID=270547 RepID=A0AAD3R130_LATJO|nr:Smith-Magenis syndrome chromosomal region candidate gene 8 protein homolog [Lates japonicus]